MLHTVSDTVSKKNTPLYVIQPQLSCEDNLLECMLELSKKDACYSWGDIIQGKLNLKLSEGSIEITSLRILFHGYGKANCKGKVIFQTPSFKINSPLIQKDELLQENMTYMKKFSHVISHPLVVSQQEYSFPIEVLYESTNIFLDLNFFQETLPDQLPTSVYSSKGHIQYAIQCTMEYKAAGENILDISRNSFYLQLELQILSKLFVESQLSSRWIWIRSPRRGSKLRASSSSESLVGLLALAGISDFTWPLREAHLFVARPFRS